MSKRITLKDIYSLLESINRRRNAMGKKTELVTYQAYGGCGIHLRYPNSGESTLLGCTTKSECHTYLLGYYNALVNE